MLIHYWWIVNITYQAEMWKSYTPLYNVNTFGQIFRTWHYIRYGVSVQDTAIPANSWVIVMYQCHQYNDIHLIHRFRYELCRGVWMPPFRICTWFYMQVYGRVKPRRSALPICSQRNITSHVWIHRHLRHLNLCNMSQWLRGRNNIIFAYFYVK